MVGASARATPTKENKILFVFFSQSTVCVERDLSVISDKS
jgi:hypothetical protein